MGSGVDPQTEYHSVVYYHEDKPRWFETLKVAVSIEEFKGCHLRFIFKHRLVIAYSILFFHVESIYLDA